MHDCSEQRGLVFEAMIEGALRDTGTPRDRLDRREAVALREEKVGRDA
jgi:hypothetical protein